MVGGRIIETRTITAGRVWVNCRDKRDECAIYVNPLGHKLKVGDSLWWQSGCAYWTPKPARGGMSDVRLLKLGYSGVSKPEARA